MGCTLPGSGQKIEKVTLRGVESLGMLCSAFDLGWLQEPDGVLIELPESVNKGAEISSQAVEVQPLEILLLSIIPKPHPLICSSQLDEGCLWALQWTFTWLASSYK